MRALFHCLTRRLPLERGGESYRNHRNHRNQVSKPYLNPLKRSVCESLIECRVFAVCQKVGGDLFASDTHDFRLVSLMQILDMGHPEDDYTRGSEVGNITNKEIRESVAKNIEAGAHLLRNLLSGAECVYSEDDERYYECKQCIEAIETIERDWTETRFHKWRSSDVPSFDLIPCGWAEAIRRYNGSGADAEAYRDEILTRITGAERTYVV